MKATKILAVLASLALMLTGCSSSGSGSSESGASEPASESTTKAATEASKEASTDKVFEIGAVTIVSHPALDAIYKGFVDELADKGFKDGEKVNLEFQNPQGDQSTLNNIANNFASADKDLYLAIATPPALALTQAIQDKPVVFAGVTDPKTAGIVKEWDAPGGNVTGTSDLNPVGDQLKLIKEINPDVKSIGIVYSSSEVNSEVQVKLAEEAAPDLGVEIQKAPIVNSAEVQQAAASLNVDAYYVPTDNVVVSALESLLQVAEKEQRLVVSGDVDSVRRGAAASVSIDYYQQGRQTARMALEILVDGKDPASMPVQLQDKLALAVNPDAAKRMGSEIPAEMAEKADETI